ncbi:hypothetical protein BRD13_04205 [Halobacteriales archaeon SW_5_70_135]|nr:MAG: hypothetical protein BRD13_04205 [Halobacteriales archaeon SW_5_70_135]
MPADLAFVFAAGDGHVGRQSVHLLRSIRRHHPDAPVYAYVPGNERESMDGAVHEELHDGATVLDGEIPVEGYPISTKVGAVAAAEDAADADYLLMVDTDTVLLDAIDVHQDYDREANLYLKPVDVGRQFWGRERSRDRWRALYDRYDVPFPDWRVESTFDGIEMLPYWNAGLVLESLADGGIGEEWLRYTRELRGEIPYDRHADQVALGLVSAAPNRSVGVLDGRYNWPLHLRLSCPPDVRVLHYHKRRELSVVRDETVRTELAAVGLDADDHRLSIDHAMFVADRAQRWLRRKTLPIDETHALERAYLRVRGVLGLGQ